VRSIFGKAGPHGPLLAIHQKRNFDIYSAVPRFKTEMTLEKFHADAAQQLVTRWHFAFSLGIRAFCSGAHQRLNFLSKLFKNYQFLREAQGGTASPSPGLPDEDIGDVWILMRLIHKSNLCQNVGPSSLKTKRFPCPTEVKTCQQVLKHF
jgi:hypothetical protein